MQFSGKDNVVLEVFLDGLRDRRGLLVDFPPHGVGMLWLSAIFCLVWQESWGLALRVNHFRAAGKRVVEQLPRDSRQRLP